MGNDDYNSVPFKVIGSCRVVHEATAESQEAIWPYPMFRLAKLGAWPTLAQRIEDGDCEE